MSLGALGALTLAVLCQPSVAADAPSVRWTSGRLRLAAGSEWDTNARRSVQGAAVQSEIVAFPLASRPFEVAGDGLFRVVIDSAAGLRLGRNHGLRGHYVLGAKRFLRETTEDLLVQEIGLASEHRATDRLIIGINGTYKGSRIRSGLRDYDVLTAGIGATARLSGNWQIDVQGRLTRFDFDAEPRFDYIGPRGSLSVSYRPRRGFSFALRGGAAWRFYDGRALVESLFLTDAGPIDVGARTFCDDPEAERAMGFECTPAGRRRDFEVTGSVNVSYRGPFLISSQYLLRLQRSNSDFENIDRHRVELSATFILPWRVTANILGALQFNQGVSITDQKFLADDDENQNSVNAGLKRPLSDTVYIEARYSLFANQFSTADVSFLRHTAYVGLGYRDDLVSANR